MNVTKFCPFWNYSSTINFGHFPSNVGAMVSIDVLCIQFWQCLVIQVYKIPNKIFVSISFYIIVGWILRLSLEVAFWFLLQGLNSYVVQDVVSRAWYPWILLLQGVQTSFSCCPSNCGEPISNLIWDKFGNPRFIWRQMK